MKLLERVNGRTMLLVGLAIIQTDLIYEFCVHRNLVSFLVISSFVILLAATLYWIGWLVRHGVTNFEVCMVIGAGAFAMVLWHDGNRVLSIAVACGGLFFAMMLLRRLLRPVDIDQQEANLSAYRAEANSVSPVKRRYLALIAYAILGVLVWAMNGFVFPRYAYFLFFLAFWDTTMLAYHFVKGQRKKVMRSPTVEDPADSGGRA
ncbi:MAG: hypothetical protein ABSG51_01435 [Terracidiphilus sp.]|jgi:fatty acid desaturase